MMDGFEVRLRRALAAGNGTLEDSYQRLAAAVLQEVETPWRAPRRGKTACYLSAEFLIGRVVYANLYNLGLLEEMREAFGEAGLDADMFEGVDDAALGNGGLGRLAACFLDSGASVGYALDGYGIRYRYGLFRQRVEDGFQREAADDWTRFGDVWSLRREDERVRVDFGDGSVWAVPYDMPVIGWQGKTVNTLRLWQAEAAAPFDFAAFDRHDTPGAYAPLNEAAAISAVLYPNDDDDSGRRLRLKQQYFFVSATLQTLVARYKKEHGGGFGGFAKQYAIQLNDTHPTIAIPELLRLLVGQEGLPFEEAFGIVQAVFAYTNHTIMAEALESWETGMFCAVAPEVYPYVVMLANRQKSELAARGITGAAQRPYRIVEGGRVQMARMAIYAGHSVNGVAALHTEILKTKALREWYELYPERFTNKTNGITPRRWLGLCNPALAAFVTRRVGEGWQADAERLRGLGAYLDDEASLRELAGIKRQNKLRLAAHVKQHEGGFALNPEATFAIQVKRLHEYKRQLLNALGLVDLYYAIKNGELAECPPLSVIIGGKAAPAYRRAKGIIKFINAVAARVNADPATRGVLQVLFVQNYNVSYAEKLMPAADLSEQISTAGTEASGTGNMKFMLNGAVTLGTYDGANVEIVREAGAENNVIFGARVEDIAAAGAAYNPRALYEGSPRIRRALDSLVDGSFSDGGTGLFRELYDSILDGAAWHRPDQYYLLMDFEAYCDARLAAHLQRHREPLAFQRKCLANIAGAGVFSSDRTIREYGEEIWGL